MSLTFWKKFCIDSGIPLLASTSYATAFADNRLTEDMIPELNKGVLKELGITLMGDIIAILKHAAVYTTNKKEGLEARARKSIKDVPDKPSKATKLKEVKPKEPKSAKPAKQLQPTKQPTKAPTKQPVKAPAKAPTKPTALPKAAAVPKPTPVPRAAMTLADHLMEAIPSPEMSPAESDYEEQGVPAPKNKRKKLAKEAPKEKMKRKEAAMDIEERAMTKARKLAQKPDPKSTEKEDNMTKKRLLLAAQKTAKEELELARQRKAAKEKVAEEARINAEARINEEVERRLANRVEARERKRAVVMVEEEEEEEEESEEEEEDVVYIESDVYTQEEDVVYIESDVYTQEEDVVYIESDGRGSESEESLIEQRRVVSERHKRRVIGSQKVVEKAVPPILVQTVRCMSPDSTTDIPPRTVARADQKATVILNTKGKCSVRPVSPPQGISDDEQRTRKVMPRVDGKSALIRHVQRHIDAPILFQAERNSPPVLKKGANIESLRSEKMNSFRSDDEIKDVLNTNKFRSETDKFATVDESKPFEKKSMTDTKGRRKAASARLGSTTLSDRVGTSAVNRLGHVRPVRGSISRPKTAKKLNIGGVAARLEMFNQSDNVGRASSHGILAKTLASDHKPVKKFTKPATAASESVFSRLGR